MNRHTRASKCIALSRILSTTNLHANSDSESDTDEITSETESLIDEVGNTDSESDNEYSGDHPFEEIGHVNESSSDQLTSPGGEIWTEVTAQRITQTGRLGASNVIRMLPGLTRYAHQRIRDQPLLDCFHIIFSFDMIETIRFETNRFGSHLLGEEWNLIDKLEMNAFLGLMIFRGVYKSSGEHIEELWSPTHGRKIFSQTMSLDRFKLIRRCLRFDNPETRANRLMRDKIAPMRLLFDKFIQNSQSAYVPNLSCTVDEQLYPYRGRCKYIQYMPNKPAKYGLKFWMLSDAHNYYIYNLLFYCGRDEQRNIPLGEYVVKTLCEPLKNSGRNITCDNFFTSLPLLRQLHSWNLTLVGTIKGSRREVPNDIVKPSFRSRDLYSTMSYLNVSEDDSTCKALLVSYKAKSNKIVTLLSSQHKHVETYEGPKRKPNVILYYNKNKGGVDAADERIGTYTTKYKSRRWHTVFFCNILDQALLNAYVLHSLHDSNWNANKSHRRRLFLKNVAEELINPHLQRKKTIALQVRISRQQQMIVEKKRGRCCQCPREADRKTPSQCKACGNFVCKEHSFLLCKCCVELEK